MSDNYLWFGLAVLLFFIVGIIVSKKKFEGTFNGISFKKEEGNNTVIRNIKDKSSIELMEEDRSYDIGNISNAKIKINTNKKKNDK